MAKKETQNTISTTLADITQESSNAMEILSKITDSLTTNSTSVSMKLVDSEGKEVVINLPTLSHIDSEIKRIDSNQQAMSGIGSTAYIKDSTGAYRQITVAKKSKEPDRIVSVDTPKTFDRKNNWFFENFLSPLLYITFNLDGLVEDTTRKINVKRIILNIDSDSKRRLFESNLESRNDLEYENTLVYLIGNNISYFVDDDVYEIPPSILRYSGSFGVLDFYDEVNVDGVTKRHYQLSNVTYTDNLKSDRNTVNLKVGDRLKVGDFTVYEIESLDLATRDIVVKKIAGTDSIPLGDDVLEIDSEIYNAKEIAVNVGFDERQIIFLSPINTDTNVTTTTYSKGTCFHSNKLIFNGSDGSSLTLEEYYKREVVDFGMSFLSLAKDRRIPSVYGLVPNKPTLVQSNFQVKQINEHLEQDALIKDVQKKVADKTRLLEEIKRLDSEIFTNNQLLQKSLNVPTEVTKYNTILDDLVKRKQNKTNEYLSVVGSLSTIYRENSKDKVTKKYRVRGFWAYPDAKLDARTGLQEVIQFVVSYRYLSKNGNSPDAKNYNYVDSQGNSLVGYFSNWVEYKTIERKRQYDTALGKFVWTPEDTSDPEVVNSNQIDIPINVGEILEVRVKSISEAGFPSNPLFSDWSESVRIEFPETLATDNAGIYAILEEAAREEERAAVLKQLDNYGLDKHFRQTRTEDNRYFAHAGSELDSGFKDASGKTISVYDQFKLLLDDLARVKGDLNKVSSIEVKNGDLNIYIEELDGDKRKFPVSNGGSVNIKPKSYYEQVIAKSVAERRGAIIRLKYNVVIENTGNGTLYLKSKFPGMSYEELPKLSGSNLVYRGTSFTDTDYLNNRMYYKVPLRYGKFSSKVDEAKSYPSLFGYAETQSTQTCGQFIYARYKAVNGIDTLYKKPEDDGFPVVEGIGSLTPKYLDGTTTSIPNNPLTFIASSTRDFIWDGTYKITRPVGGGQLTNFSIHTSHGLLTGRKSISQINNTGDTTNNNGIEQALYFNNSTLTGSKQQLAKYTNFGKHAKLGFSDFDRYLIGSNTTGAYFYMNPTNPDDIRVIGNDRKLEPGQSIRVPLTYEYRICDYFDETDKVSNSTSLLNSSPQTAVPTQSLGVVGGYDGKVKTNLSSFGYPRTLGFDIITKNDELFSFDVTVEGTYGANGNTVTLGNPSIDGLSATLGVGANYTTGLVVLPSNLMQ